MISNVVAVGYELDAVGVTYQGTIGAIAHAVEVVCRARIDFRIPAWVFGISDETRAIGRLHFLEHLERGQLAAIEANVRPFLPVWMVLETSSRRRSIRERCPSCTGHDDIAVAQCPICKGPLVAHNNHRFMGHHAITCPVLVLERLELHTVAARKALGWRI